MSAPPTPIDPERARRVELVILDVDGVMTDAGVYVGETGGGEAVELKRFDIQDGVGVKMLMWGGLRVAIVSGRLSRATAIRAAELGVTECHQEPDAHKLKVVERLLERLDIEWSAVAMLADDIPDLAVLTRVGLKCAVANATEPVRRIADWQGSRRGGHGAVRELADALLAARGDLDDVIDRYVAERSRT